MVYHTRVPHLGVKPLMFSSRPRCRRLVALAILWWIPNTHHLPTRNGRGSTRKRRPPTRAVPLGRRHRSLSAGSAGVSTVVTPDWHGRNPSSSMLAQPARAWPDWSDEDGIGGVGHQLTPNSLCCCLFFFVSVVASAQVHQQLSWRPAEAEPGQQEKKTEESEAKKRHRAHNHNDGNS